MRYVGHRASDTSPLRSIPMFRTVESVFGASPKAKAEAELRIASQSLAGELALYAVACQALGTANRRPLFWSHGPVGCRAYHQGEALRAINGRRKLVRAAQRRMAAAQVAVAALVPADAFQTPYIAQLARAA